MMVVRNALPGTLVGFLLVLVAVLSAVGTVVLIGMGWLDVAAVVEWLRGIWKLE